MTKLTRVQRQQRIAELLSTESVTSQERLVELLSADGISATQATVSRDLENLGAVKVRSGGGQSVYAIPDHPHEQIVPTEHLRRIFGEWMLSASASDNIVVIKTPPGCAHVVAAAIDRSGLEPVLGVVAGDDTVMAIAAPGHSGDAVATQFRQLAGID